MASDAPFTAEEVRQGLPAKRATYLLYLIESRTMRAVAQPGQADAAFASADSADDVQAYALGKPLPHPPSARDLERFAALWSPYIPENPLVRAALAYQMGQKYAFNPRTMPSLCAALRVDNPAVQQAYARLYGKPLTAIFTEQVSGGDWLRWLGTRLKHLLGGRG